MILNMTLLVRWAQNTAVKAKPCSLIVRGWNRDIWVKIDLKQILLKTDHIGFYELTRQNYSHDDLPGLEANLIITQGTLYNVQCWQRKTKWHWSSVQRSIFLFAKDLLKLLRFLQIVTAVGKGNMSIGVSNYLQKNSEFEFLNLIIFFRFLLRTPSRASHFHFSSECLPGCRGKFDQYYWQVCNMYLCNNI